MHFSLKTKHFLLSHRIDIAVVFLLFLMAAVPRLLDLGTFLTADEKIWIERSHNFIRAIQDRRFENTLQTTHPGVITMWLAGPLIVAKEVRDAIPFSNDTLFHFIKSGQFAIALATSLAIPLIYVFLRHFFSGMNFSKREAYLLSFTAAVFIALNPFFLGHSRVIHVDALLAVFVFLSSIASILYGHNGFSRRWLLVSAFFATLAILTKAPGVFTIPFFFLSLLAYSGTGLFEKQFLLQRLKDTALWILAIAVLYVAIWPAVLLGDRELLWHRMTTELGGAATTPHHTVEDYTLKPLHYPTAVLTRATPGTLFFGSIFLIWLFAATYQLVKKRLISEKGRALYPLWLLACFVLFFIIMMTIGAKKGDRYILPAYLGLDVMAAVGLVVAAKYISLRPFRTAVLLSFVTIGSLAFTAYTYHPYAISYANPLFPANMSQEPGWGEGLNEVADWLNEHAPESVVASWYFEELRPFTTARTVHLGNIDNPQVEYVVVYRNMFGRSEDHYATPIVRAYSAKDPEHVVTIAGREFAWVYKKDTSLFFREDQ